MWSATDAGPPHTQQVRKSRSSTNARNRCHRAELYTLASNAVPTGSTVINMLHHARTTWQEPSNPITGPAPKALTTTAVLHYSASNNIPDDKAQWLRNMQRDWVNNRGYSLGYWQLVDQAGEAWQIRGPHGTSSVYNSAANKGDKVPGNANDYTYPIILAVTTTEPASDAAIATCKQLWADDGITTPPIPHSDLDYTACCGDPVRQQIAAGLFNPTPPTPELPMRYYALPPTPADNRPHLVVWDGAVRYRANPDVDPIPEHRLNEEQYGFMLKCAGLD